MRERERESESEREREEGRRRGEKEAGREGNTLRCSGWLLPLNKVQLVHNANLH